MKCLNHSKFDFTFYECNFIILFFFSNYYYDWIYFYLQNFNQKYLKLIFFTFLFQQNYVLIIPNGDLKIFINLNYYYFFTLNFKNFLNYYCYNFQNFPIYTLHILLRDHSQDFLINLTYSFFFNLNFSFMIIIFINLLKFFVNFHLNQKLTNSFFIFLNITKNFFNFSYYFITKYYLHHPYHLS